MEVLRSPWFFVVTIPLSSAVAINCVQFQTNRTQRPPVTLWPFSICPASRRGVCKWLSIAGNAGWRGAESPEKGTLTGFFGDFRGKNRWVKDDDRVVCRDGNTFIARGVSAQEWMNPERWRRSTCKREQRREFLRARARPWGGGAWAAATPSPKLPSWPGRLWIQCSIAGCDACRPWETSAFPPVDFVEKGYGGLFPRAAKMASASVARRLWIQCSIAGYDARRPWRTSAFPPGDFVEKVHGGLFPQPARSIGHHESEENSC